MKCVFFLLVFSFFVYIEHSDAWWGGSRSSSSSSRSFSRSYSRSFSRSYSRSFSRSSLSRSWWSRGRSSSSSIQRRPHDIKTKSGLTRLYNSRVVKVEEYKRPIKGTFIPHTGVVATTSNGDRFLIHKGRRYGHRSNTVVVKANHMSNKWTKVRGKNAKSGTTIGDLVKAGGKGYNVLTNNCWGATDRIMNKAGKRKRAC